MCRAAMFIRYNRETPLKVDFGEKNYDAMSKYDTAPSDYFSRMNMLTGVPLKSQCSRIWFSRKRR